MPFVAEFITPLKLKCMAVVVSAAQLLYLHFVCTWVPRMATSNIGCAATPRHAFPWHIRSNRRAFVQSAQSSSTFMYCNIGFICSLSISLLSAAVYPNSEFPAHKLCEHCARTIGIDAAVPICSFYRIYIFYLYMCNIEIKMIEKKKRNATKSLRQLLCI